MRRLKCSVFLNIFGAISNIIYYATHSRLFLMMDVFFASVLAESCLNNSLSACLESLKKLGATEDTLSSLKVWVKEGASVTVRFKAAMRCSFEKESVRVIESPEVTVTTTHSSSSRLGSLLTSGSSEKTTTIKTTVKEYHWKLSHEYSIIAFRGSTPEISVDIVSPKVGAIEVVSRTEGAPYGRPASMQFDNIDVNLTYLMQKADSSFTIDRSDAKCLTPRRNPDVDKTLEFCGNVSTWGARIHNHFMQHIFPLQHPPGATVGNEEMRLHFESISRDGVFVPVLPLLEENKNDGVQLTVHDMSLLMQHHTSSLERRLADLSANFPTQDGKLVTINEAKVCVLMLHVHSIGLAAYETVNYVEHMLWKQVVAALGKVVTVHDINQYMAFHQRKLYKSAYAPRPFCYDVRREPGYSPEGTISIEMDAAPGTSVHEPVATCAHVVPESMAPAMRFALNAATMVSFKGEHRVHGMMLHRFSGDALPPITLHARARQFSSFVLMVGRIAAADLFEPKHALIIKDKDDVLLPLLLEPLPTPGEFRDAIASLSPEQQRFAKAFRAMQLESTLFGVCVVQIKPQLERLLCLPPGALVKEIQLTQQLMELFIEYQVWSRCN